LPHRFPESTKPPIEHAFLVGVQIFGEESLLSIDDSLEELSLLAETAGLEVVGQDFQKIDHPNPKTLIGSGKVQDIKTLAEELDADLIIFDTELSPRHQRGLEEHFGESLRVVDRTALILDIFAQHAHSREGILQVDLAQMEYRMPRLTRAWTHLARQAGGGAGRTGSIGGVGLRGPGETQLEVDKRDVRSRIAILKKEIEKVRAHRQLYRTQRKRSRIPVVALVGYTNAGKSTLLNTLTKSDVYVADQLFATLDPVTRRMDLSGKHSILFTDTVGFIQKLPTQLIAAFQATLEEIAEADLLLHLVDMTHINALAQWKSVLQTLKEISADKIPVITVMNKIDELPDQKSITKILGNFPNAVAISALKKIGIDTLITQIEKTLFESFILIKVLIPYQQGQLISLIHEQGIIQKIEHRKTGVSIQASIPGRLVTQFEPYQNKKTDS
jgi:GTP-binding protein HflX